MPQGVRELQLAVTRIIGRSSEDGAFSLRGHFLVIIADVSRISFGLVREINHHGAQRCYRFEGIECFAWCRVEWLKAMKDKCWDFAFTPSPFLRIKRHKMAITKTAAL